MKRVTKFYEKPLEDFKEDVKELTNLVKQAEEVIRSQVRDMEEREREKRKKDRRNRETFQTITCTDSGFHRFLETRIRKQPFL